MAIVTEDFSATGTRPGWTTVRSNYPVTGYSDGTGTVPSLNGSTSAVMNASARRDVDLGGIEQFTECSVVGLDSTADRTLFLYGRMGTGSTPSFYAVAMNRNLGTVSLLRYANPTSATAVLSGFSYAYPTGVFAARFWVEGTGSAVTMRLFVNGSEVVNAVDTTSSRLLTGNYGGFGAYRALSGGNGTTPLVKIDDWRAGLLSDLAPAGPEPGRGLLAA